MKKILFLILICIHFSLSSQNTGNASIKSITYTYPNNAQKIAEFKYNTAGQVINIEVKQLIVGKMGTPNKTHFINYKYDYNANGNVSQLIIAKNYDQNPAFEIETRNFIYKEGKITSVKSSVADRLRTDNPRTYSYTTTYEYESGLISTWTTEDNNTLGSGGGTKMGVKNGNVNAYQFNYNKTHLYTHDEHPNPLFGLFGFTDRNVIFSKNNIQKILKSRIHVITYTYTYDQNGLPVSAKVNDNGGWGDEYEYTITYEYL